MLKQQHQFFVGLLACVDAVVIIAATFLAWIIRRVTIEQTWWPTSWEHPPKEALVIFTVPAALVCMQWFGLYKPRRDRSLFNEASQIVKASLAAMLGVLAALYVTDSSVFKYSYHTITIEGAVLDAGRVQLGSLAILMPLMLAMERIGFRVGLRVMRTRGWNQRHVAVIGCGRLGQIVCRTLERNSWTGIRVSYFISHQEWTTRTVCLDRPIMGGLGELEQILETYKPDAVYLALPVTRANLLPDVLGRLEKFAVDVRIVPDLSPRYLPQNMAVSELDGMPILSYRENPASGLGGVSKRALDIVGALVGLTVFAPVMAVVAALVRLSGEGPVIFKQSRVSLGGQVFNIYKFRTMGHVEDERGEVVSSLERDGKDTGEHGWTRRNDPRITPIGKWLRRTSLDELPQLVNVLMGEMSLVGPRPERPELIERFREDWRGYMLRQHVKAGITGWAQINGLRGHTSLRKRLQYDLFYVKNWSIAFDIKILMLTFVRGFAHKNAH